MNEEKLEKRVEELESVLKLIRANIKKTQGEYFVADPQMLIKVIEDVIR